LEQSKREIMDDNIENDENIPDFAIFDSKFTEEKSRESQAKK